MFEEGRRICRAADSIDCSVHRGEWRVASGETQPAEIRGGEQGLPAFVEKMIVTPDVMPLPQFAITRAGPWEYITPDHIERILEAKEPRVPAYAKKHDEGWLLILVRAGQMSAWVEPPSTLSVTVGRTRFSRVYVLFGDSRFLEVSQSK